ncbi:hypothetical protein SESBI_31962 [Sesbania bispinosa]|nr:hypothetical protein SESBI_31962 [Sesbania bispinosa]
MPPKADVPRALVDEKSLRRFLKKARGDSATQASEDKLVFSTTEQRKKQKLGAQGDAQSKLKTHEEVQVGLKTTLHGNEVASIFDRRFPVEQLIARDFNKKEGRVRLNKVGMQNVGKQLQTMGMQTTFFGYCFESGLNSLDKEMKERALKMKDLMQKKAKETLETDHSDMKTKYSETVSEKEKLEKDLVEVLEQKKQLVDEKMKIKSDVESLQKEIAIQHARGFNKAVSQIQCLHPTINVEGVGGV